MSYFVNRSNKYRDSRTGRDVPAYRYIHRSDCPHAVRRPRGPGWDGPFDSLRHAKAWARSTGDPVRLCSACKPGRQT